MARRGVAAAAAAVAALCAPRGGAAVRVDAAAGGRPAAHGVRKLTDALALAGVIAGKDAVALGDGGARVVVRLSGDVAAAAEARGEDAGGAFALRRDPHRRGVSVDAGGDAGAMYGLLELASQVRRLARHGVRGWDAVAGAVREVAAAPRFEYRAVKFNLPISAYRSGTASELNYADCRDLAFWEEFLDMMAENRFAQLTLWALHPWPFMVTPQNFSKAVSYSDTSYWGGNGTETEADWRAFWTGLFKMAKDRAIDPYIIDWNIFLSEGYKAHYDTTAITDHDGHGGNGTDNAQARRYGREIITQTINEYPDLAGVGFTLGERMKNLGEDTGNLTAQVKFAEDVVLDAIANADRKVNLIYRAALDNKAPKTVRASIDSFVKRMLGAIKVWVQLKFNWSHGHSTTKLVHAHGGGTGSGYWEPPDTSYKMAWMMRNEDFHFLRWGQAPFIRAHIAMNGEAFVGGYIMGSEEHIPATDYASKAPSSQRGWKYDFERQWLWYMQWGRLLFDPTTPDDVFAAEFEQRYNLSAPAATALLGAVQNASIFPLRFASFVYNTWDFTLHSETFESKSFVDIEELMSTKTLDPSLQSVNDFVDSSVGAPPSCAVHPGIDCVAKKALPGNPRQASDSAACCDLCAQTEDCKAWTFYPDQSKCYLKAGCDKQKSADGAESGGDGLGPPPPAPTPPAPAPPGPAPPAPAPAPGTACMYPHPCTPLELADELDAAGATALSLVADVRNGAGDPTEGALAAELDDASAWAHLSKYFALKLRGAVSLATYRKHKKKEAQTQAVTDLTAASSEWKSVCSLMGSRLIDPVPSTSKRTFTWCGHQKAVDKDVDTAKNG